MVSHQLAATVALPRGFILLDLGLCLTFGIEDLFFFFCSSRPIPIVEIISNVLCNGDLQGAFRRKWRSLTWKFYLRLLRPAHIRDMQ